MRTWVDQRLRDGVQAFRSSNTSRDLDVSKAGQTQEERGGGGRAGGRAGVSLGGGAGKMEHAVLHLSHGVNLAAKLLGVAAQQNTPQCGVNILPATI